MRSMPSFSEKVFKDGIRRSDLAEPVWVRQRQVRESAFPLDEVPRRPDVVVPGDDPLHRVANHVEVDRLGDVEPGKVGTRA